MKKPVKVFSVILCLAGVALAVWMFRANAAEMFSDSDDFELKWIIPQAHYFGNSFADNRAWVQKDKNGPWTLYDADGNIIKDGLKRSAFQCTGMASPRLYIVKRKGNHYSLRIGLLSWIYQVT
jgi:hypothetical protein